MSPQPSITDTGAAVREGRRVPVYSERDAGIAWELHEARNAIDNGNERGIINTHISNALDMLKAQSAVPETRNTHDVLAALCQLAEEQLAVSRHILAALGATGSIPSVELSVDSKALVKPVVKVYNLDPEQANQEAQRIFDDLVIKYAPKNGTANG